jgi:hypothetical protein
MPRVARKTITQVDHGCGTMLCQPNASRDARFGVREPVPRSRRGLSAGQPRIQRRARPPKSPRDPETIPSASTVAGDRLASPPDHRDGNAPCGSRTEISADDRRFNRCGGVTDPSHQFQQLGFGGGEWHSHSAEHTDRLSGFRRQVGYRSGSRAPTNFLERDPVETEMHAFDADVGAEREEAILLLHQTAIIAECTGSSPENVDDIPYAIEFGAGTKSL